MGRRIQYDRSRVTGYRRKEKGGWQEVYTEDFIHQRQQDPILIACRRNHRLAGCDMFDVHTEQAFDRWVDDVIMQFVPSRAAAVPEYEW